MQIIFFVFFYALYVTIIISLTINKEICNYQINSNLQIMSLFRKINPSTFFPMQVILLCTEYIKMNLLS